MERVASFNFELVGLSLDGLHSQMSDNKLTISLRDFLIVAKFKIYLNRFSQKDL